MYQEALGLARRTRQPDEEALALEDIGDCHIRAGDSDAGVASLTRALGIFQRLAMAPDLDRVRARLADVAT